MVLSTVVKQLESTMQPLNVPTPSDERDSFVVKSLILLSILLLVSTYFYRSFVTDSAYEQPFAKTIRPALVQTHVHASAE